MMKLQLLQLHPDGHMIKLQSIRKRVSQMLVFVMKLHSQKLNIVQSNVNMYYLMRKTTKK